MYHAPILMAAIKFMPCARLCTAECTCKETLKEMTGLNPVVTDAGKCLTDF